MFFAIVVDVFTTVVLADVFANLTNGTTIIYHNIPHTPSKVGVVARKTFSHTPDEAMSDGLAKACGLGKMYSVKENISHFIENQTE